MKSFSICLLSLLLIFFSCATTQKRTKLPDWILKVQVEKDGYIFFRGVAEDEDILRAEETAMKNVVNKIIEYIGVNIEAVTDTSILATIKDYQSNVEQSIKATGKGKIKGLTVEDKFNQQTEKGYKVYVLAKYAKKELENEQKRLNILQKEIDDAVSIPEKKGDQFYNRHSLFKAFVSYIEAVNAAIKVKEIENREIKIERNFRKAEKSLQEVSLIKLIDNLNFDVGKKADKSFDLKVVHGSEENDPGISDVPLVIKYDERRGKNIRAKSVNITTDNNGQINFFLPKIDLVGNHKIKIWLDIDSYLVKLSSLPEKYQDRIRGLESISFTKEAEFTYQAMSAKSQLPLLLILVESDLKGQVQQKSNAKSSLINELKKGGMKIHEYSYNPKNFFNITDSDLINKIRNINIQEAEIIVFVKMGYRETKKIGSRYVVTANGEMMMYERKKNNIIYSNTYKINGTGSKEEMALKNAYQKMSTNVSRDVILEL